ncbi:MAG: DUF1624 domain-containing protein [Oscillospiraceae bacterium]|jgi:uncharacterized membrane protein|nr:DUF1624 domain-containing protein [Oscillospiraceae bacterium]
MVEWTQRGGERRSPAIKDVIFLNRNQNRRAGFLDEVRGFAILCMVVYHVLFDLKNFYGVNVPVFFDGWFYIVRDVFAGSFIFISGIVCRYSRDNTKRGAQCFLLGMAVTFATAFAAPETPVLFGILHLLGICMILYGLVGSLWDILPAFAGIILNVFLFALTRNVYGGYIGIGGFSLALPEAAYNARLLFPLGFAGDGFVSGDYFPLLPWFFLFIAGSYFGVYVKDNRCPAFFYETRVRFFAAAGRHTIWIYLLHQPLAAAVLYLIFKK